MVYTANREATNFPLPSMRPFVAPAHTAKTEALREVQITILGCEKNLK
jgi:hypothetical protein